MSIIKINYSGKLTTIATHINSGNILSTDAPLDNFGKGSTFSPTDLFATSLGSCMLTIMGIAGNTHGINIDGANILLEKIMSKNPRRIGELNISIVLPQNLSKNNRIKIERAAKHCPVAKSLHPKILKKIKFIYSI